jgi:hypothetical protein
MKNPYIGLSVVTLTTLRTANDDALNVYPFPTGDKLKRLLNTKKLLTEAHSIAVSSKNYGL